MSCCNMANIQREGLGSIKVLLIPPLLERNYETLFKHFKPEFRKLFSFYIIKPIPRHDNGTVDYSKLLDLCMTAVKSENIGIVFANKQAGVLVWAILCQKFNYIRGPSAESVFLSNHEYYRTIAIDAREHKVPFSLHTFGDDCYDFAFRVMTSIVPPCVMRPCLGIGHSSYEFHNRDELLMVANQCKSDTEHIVGMHSYLINNFVNLEKYPMASAPVVFLSAVLDSPYTKVHIEACVFQKDIIPWNICEMIKSPTEENDTTSIFSGLKMPSELSSKLQEKLWTEFKKDVSNLIEHGLDYTFVHGEYDVYDDGFIHLVALCIGPNANNTKMYTQAMEMGNNVEAAFQVSMGIRPQQPTNSLNGKVILNHLMLVFEPGKADSLINFTRALSNPNVWLRYLPGQDIIIEPAKSHAVIGCIVAKGNSVKQCIEKIKALRKENLKILDHVPLTCQNSRI